MRATRIGWWALRIFLAVAFLFFGVIKFPSDEGSMWVNTFAKIGLGQWFRYLTGVLEAGGGILLLIPAATPLAVAMLAPTMIGALLTHALLFGLQPATFVVIMLLAGVLAIGWDHRSSRKAAVSAPALKD